MTGDRRRRADGWLTPRAAGRVARFGLDAIDEACERVEIGEEVGTDRVEIEAGAPDLYENPEHFGAEASPSGHTFQVGCEPTTAATHTQPIEAGASATIGDVMPPAVRAAFAAQLRTQCGGDPEGVVDDLI